MQAECEDCKVELRDKTGDPNKCSEVGYFAPGIFCHNCAIWGLSGVGNDSWYEEKACVGCKGRLIDGRFKAADKWKAKADEMKAKLAPSPSPAEVAEAKAKAEAKAESEARAKREAAAKAQAQAQADAAAQRVAGLSLGGAGSPSAAASVPHQAAAGASSGRTLKTSNFKAAYAQTQEATEDYTLLAAMDAFLTGYFRANGWPDQEAKQFIKLLREEGHKASDQVFMEGLSDVGGFAQRMWSSATPGHGREFCSMVNDAIRGDDSSLMQHLAVFARTMNAGLITRRTLDVVPWPPKSETYRGAILPERHLQFYIRMTGHKYRVPGFLATSFSEDVADEFAMRAWQSVEGKDPAVRYVIRVHPEGATRKVRRCQHVSLIRKSNKPKEEEFLFVPYSTFKVLKVTTSPTPNYLTPNVVELESSIDNMIEPEDLPLAPWY